MDCSYTMNGAWFALVARKGAFQRGASTGCACGAWRRLCCIRIQDSTPRVRLIVHPQDRRRIDVGIALSRGQRRMPEQLPDLPQVRAIRQPMPSETVTRRVRGRQLGWAPGPVLKSNRPPFGDASYAVYDPLADTGRLFLNCVIVGCFTGLYGPPALPAAEFANTRGHTPRDWLGGGLRLHVCAVACLRNPALG